MRDIYFAADIDRAAFAHDGRCICLDMAAMQAGQIEGWIRDVVQPYPSEKVEFLAATAGDWQRWAEMHPLDMSLLNETVRRVTVAADDHRVQRRIERYVARHGRDCVARAQALAWAVTDQK